jgi:hypothetical protein
MAMADLGCSSYADSALPKVRIHCCSQGCYTAGVVLKVKRMTDSIRLVLQAGLEVGAVVGKLTLVSYNSV